MRVLIIEDEEDIADFLSMELRHEGMEADRALDGRAGLEMALEGSYDLILLDVMLPQLSGIEVLRRLRKRFNTPVILLTARDSVMDKVTGLDMGANDYVTKPFHIEELLARIRALTRTGHAGDAAAPLRVADLELDDPSHTIRREGRALSLSKKEYDLLAYLMRNHDIVLTREQLLSQVWGYDYAGESNIVDVYIRYVRAKVNEGFEQAHIDTVRGVGYVLKGQPA